MNAIFGVMNGGAKEEACIARIMLWSLAVTMYGLAWIG